MRYANLLIAELDKIGTGASKSLKRGVSSKTVASRYKKFLKQPHYASQPNFPPTLPRQLVGLYEWKNGGGDLVPFHEFINFDTALEAWDIVSEAVEDSAEYENGNAVFADTSIFPFLGESGGNYVVMDVGRGSPTRGSIGYFSVNGFSSVRNEFGSLAKFFQAHYQCLKEGKYFLNQDGILDFEERHSILDRFRTKDIRTANGGSLGY